MNTKKLTLLAIFISAAIALSLAERALPVASAIPLPGIRLGLANIVVMWALFSYGFGSALAISAARCVIGSFFSGSVTALAFSLSGGLLSLMAMALLKKAGVFSIWGISCVGAIMHNMGQIAACCALFASLAPVAYTPVLLAAGVIMGVITATATSSLMLAFERLRRAGV